MADSIATKQAFPDHNHSKNFPNDNSMKCSNSEGRFSTGNPNNLTLCPAASPMKSSQYSPNLRMRQSSFALKLHEMLNETDKLPSLKAIVSWQPHGRAFIVHNTFLFIMEANKQRFFKQTKYASFQRQLNLYGFSRISAGIDKGAYYHKLFLRGMPGLCHQIQRLRIKGTKVRKPASPATEPDFYSMPACLPPTSSHGRVNQELGPYAPAACQPIRPSKSRFSASNALALPVKRNDDVLSGQVVPIIEGKRFDGTDQTLDTTPLEYLYCCSLETDTVLLAETQSQPLPVHGQVKSVVGSTSYSMEEIKESADLEHDMFGRNDPVIVTGLTDFGGRILSTSMDKISYEPRTDMSGFPKPCQIARSVTDSPDRTRAPQFDNKPVSGKAASSHNVESMSEGIPLVLHFQLPTNAGKANMSNKITFIPPVHRQPKVGMQTNTRMQVDHLPLEIDRKVPIVLGQSDEYDQHAVFWPLPGLVSDQDNQYRFLDDTTESDGLALSRNWNTTEQDGILGLEKLPPDTELEEFIALSMTRMNHN